MFLPLIRKYTNVTQLQSALRDVDVIVEEGGHVTSFDEFLAIYNLTDNSTFPFIQNRAVYTVDLTQSRMGSYDWFESVLAEADLLLEDLIAAVHTDYPTLHQRYWLRWIAGSEQPVYLNSTMCINIDEPADPRGDACISVLPSSCASGRSR